MLPLAALQCNQDIFKAIYQNLSLYGTPGHETLKIMPDESGAYGYPVTSKKTWLDLSDIDQKTSGFVLDFLKKNITHLAAAEHPHQLLSKFEPMYKRTEESTHFHELRQELYNLHAVKSTEAERESILQDARAQELSILQKTKRQIQDLQAQLADLQKSLQDLEDTLIVCQDISLSVHRQRLQKMAFFKRCFQHPEMHKTTLSETDKRHYKYKFEFVDFHSKTLMAMMAWIDDPKSLDKVKEFNALYELYRLADQLNDDTFRQDCRTQLCRHLNAEHALEVLTIAEYTANDEMLGDCYRKVAYNFRDLKDQPKYLEIKPEYFVRIVQVKKLYQLDEEAAFKAIRSWVYAEAKRSSKTPQEVFYNNMEGKNLASSIPFKCISKAYFMSHIKPVNLLTSEDALKWMEYYMEQADQPVKKNQDVGIVTYGDDKAEITLNIPLDTFSSIGDWDGDRYDKPFSCLGFSWGVELGKSNAKAMIFALRIWSQDRDFRFFLDIAHIQIYSKTSSQKTAFANNGLNDGNMNFIKGISIPLEELERLYGV